METRYKSTLYFFKGIFAGIFALVVKQLTAFITLSFYTGEFVVGDIPNFAICIVLFLSSILVYSSAFRVVFSFDMSAATDYLTCTSEGDTAKRALFLNRTFIPEAVGASLITSLFAVFGSAFEIAGMFHFGDGKSRFSEGIIPFAVTLIITSLASLLSRYEACRFWRSLEKEKNLESVTNKFKILLRVLAVFMIYPLATPFLPLAFFMLVTLFQAVPLFITGPIAIGILAALILSVIVIKYILTVKIRKNFFLRVRDVVRQHGFEISDIQNPYISLLRTRRKCTFTVKTKKETFDCIVIGRIRRGVPVCFTTGSLGYFRYRIGTKKHNITFERYFEYDTSGEGKKILIICPSPKHAFICDGETGKEKRLYNSDKLWEFVAYEDEAFISALDRECLGKYSSVAENNDIKMPRPINLNF